MKRTRGVPVRRSRDAAGGAKLGFQKAGDVDALAVRRTTARVFVSALSRDGAPVPLMLVGHDPLRVLRERGRSEGYAQ